jgi:primosomal protein N' (replication factor Y)
LGHFFVLRLAEHSFFNLEMKFFTISLTLLIKNSFPPCRGLIIFNILMNKIAKIALPVPTRTLFSYEIPPEYVSEDLVGRRALVPFGRRTLTGYIIETAAESDIADLKQIREILDERPVFSEKMLRFAAWIAEYYMASPGETLKAALPQGMSPKSVMQVRILRRPDQGEIARMRRKATRRAALLEELLTHDEYISVGFLEQTLKTKNISAQLEALVESGYIELRRLVEKASAPVKQQYAEIDPGIMADEERLRQAMDELDKRALKQSMIMSKLFLAAKAGSPKLLISDLIRETSASRSAINALVDKELLRIGEMEIDRSIAPSDQESLARRDESALELSEEQEFALDMIIEALDPAEYKPFLLHGVTGSGKTLIYIHAIRRTIDSGRTALVLVPEISLTPQLIDRFERVFPDNIAVFHSRMSQGERYDSWRSIHRGRAKIVIGARSAVFAPLENVGLVIVDEEHESSYKQDSPAPRYHARDCAVVRARLEKAVIVLGSATPSLESMYNARTGRYTLLKITGRADGARMPRLRVLDMLNARKSGNNVGAFSKDLLDSIADRVGKKEGVILFQNRRGFSAMLECPDCGHIPECRDCAVTLTYHRSGDYLRCHYCGYTINAHKACPACGHPEMNIIGTGTQRIENELGEYLEDNSTEAEIKRMDLDTTSRKGAHRRMLRDFAAGRTDILLGTQMVAKGLDFDRVTLVGVVSADIQLFIPDFRASERTFGLLTQVAGRAGRKSGHPGEVIIQTSHPESPPIKSAIVGSYDLFYEDEIENRRQAMYPPFSRFVLIEFYGRDEHKTAAAAKAFASAVPDFRGLIKLGPVAPTIYKIRRNFRRIMIIKDVKQIDPSGKILRLALGYALDEYNRRHSSSAVRMSIDIDSYSAV